MSFTRTIPRSFNATHGDAGVSLCPSSSAKAGFHSKHGLAYIQVQDQPTQLLPAYAQLGRRPNAWKSAAHPVLTFALIGTWCSSVGDNFSVKRKGIPDLSTQRSNQTQAE